MTLAVVAVAATAGTARAACTPAVNVQAIVDDSLSMFTTDYDGNRVEALKLLISKTGNAGKSLGAVEFGSAGDDPVAQPAARTVFAPQPMGLGGAMMAAALDASIKADERATDYNAAFAKAAADNPAADARIFITDGGHSEGDYAEGHRGGPRTYVIGLEVYDADDVTRLRRIADETGGRYYSGVTRADLAATVNKIDAALNCGKINKTYTDRFTRGGKSKRRSIRVRKGTRSAELVLTWESPRDRFSVGSIRLVTKNGTLTNKTKRRLTLKRRSGKTFATIRVAGLKPGRLRFTLRSRKIRSSPFGTVKVKLTTQVTFGATG